MSTLSDIISKAAPILGGLLTGGPVGAGLAAVKLIASEFGGSTDANTLTAAIQADPQATIKLKKLELDHKLELQRLLLASEGQRIAEVNMTMRAEAAANDPYVRRWRPTIGYVVAAQLALLGASVFAVVIGAMMSKDPAQAKALFDGLATLTSSLTAIMTVELTVLGVNIAKRSQDKALAAGVTPGKGLIAAIVGSLGK